LLLHSFIVVVCVHLYVYGRAKNKKNFFSWFKPGKFSTNSPTHPIFSSSQGTLACTNTCLKKCIARTNFESVLVLKKNIHSQWTFMLFFMNMILNCFVEWKGNTLLFSSLHMPHSA
jgi:hypothetical protein